ncbi:MAG: hypothetical protein HOZ81_40740 [Streptomyces sp.]|nr:hypothetical protein [Streptomyces sp.]
MGLRRHAMAVEEVDALTSETVERVRVVNAGSSVVEELHTQVLLQGEDLAAMAEAAGFTIGAVWGEDFARHPNDELGSATGNVNRREPPLRVPTPRRQIPGDTIFMSSRSPSDADPPPWRTRNSAALPAVLRR